MDILLSLSTTKKRLPDVPALLSASQSHAAGQCTVADDRDNVVLLVFKRACMRHTRRHRHRIWGMSGHARVSNTFFRLHKTAQTAVLPQRVKAVAPTGQDLVDIALMTYIVDDAVARGVELALECNSQLYNAQIGRQMTAGLRHRVHNELAQLRAPTPPSVSYDRPRADRQDL